jgi:iron complex outermembrane receptor protein
LLADVYVLWVASPAVQVRLTVSNLAPRDYLTGGAMDSFNTAPGGLRETTLTTAPTYVNWQLRLEIRV